MAILLCGIWTRFHLRYVKICAWFFNRYMDKAEEGIDFDNNFKRGHKWRLRMCRFEKTNLKVCKILGEEP